MTAALKVISNHILHEPPFVLVAGRKRVGIVFRFLRLLHLRGVSKRTIRAYAFDLLAFYRFLDEQNLTLDILQPSHFADFILSGRKENAAPRTINRRLTTVRSFLNFWADGRGDELFGETCPAFYKGARNRALLGKSRLKANAHKFRHTFCTNMIRQGVSLPVVQKLMGHSDIEVTMGYVHLSIDDVSREYHRAIASLEKTHQRSAVL